MSARLAFDGARVTVMGLGLFGGGAAVVRFLVGHGARVTVTDLRPRDELGAAVEALEPLGVRWVLGEHREEDFRETELVVANPAVPPTSRYLAAARDAGVGVSSEIALFLERCRGRVVCVTGTQGKSSTTSFTAQLLEACGQRTFLGGNIGVSLLDRLDEIGPDDACAIELSSYQLETLPDQWDPAPGESPIKVAVFTNLLADHLERHGSREAYVAAKLRLLERVARSGSVLLPRDGLPERLAVPAGLRVLRHPSEALRVEGERFLLEGEVLGRVDATPLAATFQRENLLLALAAARSLGASAEALGSALPRLRGIPYRLDPLGELGGRVLWDNSVSTTPDSTISALEALPAGATLILGGKVKSLPVEPLIAAALARGTPVVVFGAARAVWSAPFRAAGLEVREAAGPRQALALALGFGSGPILVSPACASFDAYPNFEARAREFHAAAAELGLVPFASSSPEKGPQVPGREGALRL